MKKFLCILTLLSSVSMMMAQTTHTVTVTSNQFSPNTLTIQQGDIVNFDCTQGCHNVNGTTTTFPSNPASFGNAVACAPWSQSFTFNTPGTYSYQCDPHAAGGMTGTITVQGTPVSTPFTSGNVVVARVGTGAAALSGSATAVFLDEYAITVSPPSITLVQSVALPTADNGANQMLTVSGTSTSEASLQLSADGQYVTIAGYDAAPGTATVSSAAGIDRIIARIAADGTVNTTTGITSTTGYAGASIRGAVTNDGTGFWCSGTGTGGGTRYVPFGSVSATSVQLSSAPTNTRVVNIFGGQLYMTSASSTFHGISAVGTGLPTTSGQTTTIAPGFPTAATPSPYAFQMLDLDPTVPGVDVAYVADDRTGTGGGVQKWSLVNGTWVNNGTFLATGGVRGLTIRQTCAGIVLIGTNNTTIVVGQDNAGYNVMPATATLAPVLTATTNTVFRGIAATPGTTPPAPLAVMTMANNTTCGANNGASMAMPSGGAGTGYTYVWSDGQTVQTATGLAAGTYTVTVTDATSCTATASALIVGSTSISTTTMVNNNPSCFGASNGSAMAMPNGTSPYTYVWSDGQTAVTASGLAAGSYIVTVTDATACTASASVTITDPTAISASATTTSSSCGAANGTINLTVSGGTAPYSFNWGGGVTTEDRTNLLAGTYTVTITAQGGCTATFSATVGNLAAFTATTSNTSVSCAGGANGTASASVTGGTTPYTYAWSNGGTNATINGLAAGTYTLTVTDAAACQGVYTVTITAPAPLSPTSNTTSTDVLCAGQSNGTATIALNGGTTPYTYAWSNGATSTTITGLAAGSYVVTATDANGCTLDYTFAIAAPAVLTLGGLPTSTDVTCNGLCNGTLSNVVIVGGTMPYTYLWSNGATTANLNNLCAGAYTGTVTDANGCTYTPPVALTINEPAVLTLGGLPTSTDVTCNGLCDGTLSNVVIVGGTTPYSYLWSNGATTANLTALCAGSYTGTVTDANGCTYTPPVALTINQPTALVVTATVTDATTFGGTDGAVTPSVSGGTAPYTTTGGGANLAAGTYTVNTVDANGCTATATFTVSQPNGTTSIANISNLTLSPNPTDANIQVVMDLKNADDVMLAVFSPNGQMIAQQAFGYTQTINYSVNLSNLPAGMYMVRLNVGTSVITMPIVKL